LIAADNCRDCRRREFNGERVGFDRYHFGDVADFERDVQSARRADVHLELARNVFLKTARLDGHIVSADVQIARGVTTVVIRGDGPRDLFLGRVGDGDGGAFNGSAVGVFHRAYDRAGDLLTKRYTAQSEAEH
jgi:hypothetical protein